jgi:Nucleotidyl transferase AbiEii toxin, Type IV TA system
MKLAGTEIPLADLELMAAMKAAALHDRGAKRDFIDIHAICSQPAWSVPRFIEHAARMLPLEPAQIRLALTYYVDADKEPCRRAARSRGMM